jgi:hypothetical protein
MHEGRPARHRLLQDAQRRYGAAMQIEAGKVAAGVGAPALTHLVPSEVDRAAGSVSWNGAVIGLGGLLPGCEPIPSGLVTRV